MKTILHALLSIAIGIYGMFLLHTCDYSHAPHHKGAYDLVRELEILRLQKEVDELKNDE